MADIKEHARIKRLLPTTWHAFFTRFGRFTSIQLSTIPEVLAGKNVFISSKTASGKTEAAVAPLLENLDRKDYRNLSILYISPTRALVNDALKRLSTPFDRMPATLSRRTGDYSRGFDPENPPTLLITTPESLDSMFTKYPWAFGTVKSIIIDELHLLDNTPRGDQLFGLTARLEAIRKYSGAKDELQYVALTATTSDPRETAIRYFSDPVLISDPSKRDIEFHFIDAALPGYAANLINELKQRRIQKALFFCNSRSDCELLARVLNKPPYYSRVYVHHASLKKEERERVEYKMNNDRIGLCAATMTLELGIDIGDIEAVGLFGPPWTVSSFLQRIGRGCRRKGDYSLAFGLHRNDGERLMLEIMLRESLEGRVEKKDRYPRYGTAVQQIFSYMKQTRRKGATRQGLSRIMRPYLHEIEPFVGDRILDHLISLGYLASSHSQVFHIGSKLGDMIEKHRIYSNISLNPPGSSMDICSQDDGKKIGECEDVPPEPGSSILLGGRKWKVVSVRSNCVMVRQMLNAGSAALTFTAQSGPQLEFDSAQLIKKRLMPYFDEPYVILYKAFKNLHFYFHFWGSFMSEIMAVLMKKRISEDKKQFDDGKGIAWISENLFTADDFALQRMDFEHELTRNGKRYEKFFSFSPFRFLLPDELKQTNLIEAARLERLSELCRNIRLVEIHDELFDTITAIL